MDYIPKFQPSGTMLCRALMPYGAGAALSGASDTGINVSAAG
jgi:hypothetical protein